MRQARCQPGQKNQPAEATPARGGALAHRHVGKEAIRAPGHGSATPVSIRASVAKVLALPPVVWRMRSEWRVAKAGA